LEVFVPRRRPSPAAGMINVNFSFIYIGYPIVPDRANGLYERNSGDTIRVASQAGHVPNGGALGIIKQGASFGRE